MFDIVECGSNGLGAFKVDTHRWLLTVSLLSASVASQAGVWGQENWGEMYWGSNPVSAPSAPVISSIVADGADLIVRIADYQPGDDGWSVVTNYTVSCGQISSEAPSGSAIRVTGLASETQYACSVSATNAAGQSESSVSLATTEPELQGLNLILIRSALCASDNPPANC